MMFFKRPTTPRKKQRSLPISGRARLDAFANTPQTKSNAPLPIPTFNSALFEPLEPRLLLSGTTYIVNTLADTPINGDDNLLTLREAITAANSNAPFGANIPAGSAFDVDQITFNLPALQAEANGAPLTITLNGTELAIKDDLDIQGPTTQTLTLNANQLSRIFNITQAPNAIISDLTLTGGFTTNHGGAIRIANGTVQLTNTTLTNNASVNEIDTNNKGGAIFNIDGVLTITNSILAANTAEFGGAIYNRFGELVIINSKLYSNTAQYKAGATHNYNGTTTIINSTLTANTAEHAGASYNNFGQLTITNTTYAANIAQIDGGAILNDDGPITINNSIIALNQSPAINSINGNFNNDAINNTLIDFNPGFVRNPTPGPDGLWATPDDDLGDLHLQSTSLAINFGNHALALDANTQPLTADHDGATRIADSQIDLGAYEFQGAPSPQRETFSPVVTTLDDTENSTDNLISLREATTYAQILQQDISFAPQLAGGTITLNARDLFIRQSISIDASSIGGVTIDANHQSRIFSITNNPTVTFTALTLNNGDTAADGGAIYIDQGTLTLNNSTVSNSNGLYGGAIYINQGTLTLNNSTIADNSAADGGGIYTRGTLIINDSIITDNSASSDGGGIHHYNYLKQATINNSTLSNNSANYGGGIYNRSKITLNDSNLTGNSASYGGGIYSRYGNYAAITFNNTTVSENLARSRGGGIYNGKILTLNNSHITNNSTDSSGAGIYLNDYSTTTITNSSITGNTTLSDGGSSGNGGGIYIDTNSILTLANSTVNNNVAVNDGGGIYNLGTLTIKHASVSANSTFLINTPTNYSLGGGIYNNGALTINHSDVSNNKVDTGNGAGIYNRASAVISNSTINGNSITLYSNNYGGGIYNGGISTLTLTNSTVTLNSAVGGSAIYNGGMVTVNNSTITANTNGIFLGAGSITLNNSIVALNPPQNPSDIFHPHTNNNSLITTDPLFTRNPSPGPDGLYATSDDDLGDLRLLPNSPAINTGSNAFIPPNTHFDIDDAPRIIDSTVDIGAYEFYEFLLTSTPGDLNGDHLANTADVDLVSAALNTNNSFPLYDINGDFDLTPQDGLHLLSILNIHLADFDLNYQVDVADLSTWATGFGKTSAVYSQGDANFDGQIDVADLSLWATNFGKTSTPPAPLVTAPLTQSSAAVTDTYILDTNPTPTNNFSTPAQDRWANIKNLLNPTSSPNQKLDIIKNIQTL